MTRTAPTILALLVMMGAVRADAQTIRALGGDRVAVKAEGAAIGDLIDQLAPQSSLKFIALDPADRGVRVSLVVDDVEPLDAIVLALKASGLDYAMTGTRLIAGRAKKALENGGPVSWAATREVSPPPDRRVHEPRPDFTEQPAPAAVAIAARDAAAPATSMNSAPALPAAQAEAPFAVMSVAKFTNDDDFGRNLSVPNVPFVMREDSAVVTQPGFVPYKLRPEVKNRRLFANVADIP